MKRIVMCLLAAFAAAHGADRVGDGRDAAVSRPMVVYSEWSNYGFCVATGSCKPQSGVMVYLYAKDADVRAYLITVFYREGGDHKLESRIVQNTHNLTRNWTAEVFILKSGAVVESAHVQALAVSGEAFRRDTITVP